MVGKNNLWEQQIKMNFKEEIFKSIQGMVNKAVANCKVDRTYESVIKDIMRKWLIISKKP